MKKTIFMSLIASLICACASISKSENKKSDRAISSLQKLSKDELKAFIKHEHVTKPRKFGYVVSDNKYYICEDYFESVKYFNDFGVNDAKVFNKCGHVAIQVDGIDRNEIKFSASWQFNQELRDVEIPQKTKRCFDVTGGGIDGTHVSVEPVTSLKVGESCIFVTTAGVYQISLEDIDDSKVKLSFDNVSFRFK